MPGLKWQKWAKVLLLLYGASAISFIFWLGSVHADLMIHSELSSFPLGFIFSGLLLPMVGVLLLGVTRLPAETFDELIDDMISRNVADLLADDKKEFKELIRKELNLERIVETTP